MNLSYRTYIDFIRPRALKYSNSTLVRTDRFLCRAWWLANSPSLVCWKHIVNTPHTSPLGCICTRLALVFQQVNVHSVHNPPPVNSFLFKAQYHLKEAHRLTWFEVGRIRACTRFNPHMFVCVCFPVTRSYMCLHSIHIGIIAATIITWIVSRSSSKQSYISTETFCEASVCRCLTEPLFFLDEYCSL